MKTQTRKTSALTVKTLLHVAQPGARLLVIGDGAFLVNPATHDHWYTNSATFDSLRANGWITAPTAIDANVAESYITEAGRDVAAAVETAKRGYTQLSLEEVLEELESAAAQVEEPEVITDQAVQKSEEFNPMTLTTTFERIAQHVTDVTSERIGRCHKVFEGSKHFYKVENERGDVDPASGEVIEYTVKCTAEHGFTCTCKSGENGFSNVRHPSGVCKHVRWSVACELEERAALAEIQGEQADQEEQASRPAWYNPANETSHHDGTRAHLLLVGKLEADDATYTRVMLAQPAQPSEAEIRRDQERYANRPPFQI
jgi:hypothetical protein